MLKTYISVRDAALRLRDNQDGVVSFEYVMVAACIVAAVVAAFGTKGGTGAVGSALTAALKAVTDQL
jgi:Flp pilus assembly pilin Flp